jgi:hypothetical protein
MAKRFGKTFNIDIEKNSCQAALLRYDQWLYLILYIIAKPDQPPCNLASVALTHNLSSKRVSALNINTDHYPLLAYY